MTSPPPCFPSACRLHRVLALCLLAVLLLPPAPARAAPPDAVRGLYLPGHGLSARRLDEVVHYAPQLDLNAVVLHVKDPWGRLYFDSRQPLALATGASAADASAAAVRRCRAAGLWTAAKIDVFVDDRLARWRPEMAVRDRETGAPWVDDSGLCWVNPYDERVWDYNIGLAVELAALGFDEIQFDYIRFPSDGDLDRIVYPNDPPGPSRTACIGRFLAAARRALGDRVVLSVDLFGLTAWKTDDFGVGQVIEAIAPHVDVICPMLYPSHFPVGFLGWKEPGRHPREIMRLSVERLRRRTDRIIRPWVQGFWYPPEMIVAQLEGLTEGGADGWMVWHPSGRYGVTYEALGRHLGRTPTAPVLYPDLASLRERPPRRVRGRGRVVNLTDYGAGWSVLSLEAPQGGAPGPYAFPAGVVATLDEAILDRVLACRRVAFGPLTRRLAKAERVAALLSEDLGVSPRRMRPGPVFLDWEGGCGFSARLPAAAHEAYRTASARPGEGQ